MVKGNICAGEGFESGCYVQPSIAEIDADAAIVQTETFAPLLYLIKYEGGVENAIEIQNDVRPEAFFRYHNTEPAKSETFLSHWGVTAGIANVNIGTSGAEIGGALVEKKKPGVVVKVARMLGRFMRRQSNTLNFSDDLPLAQGINFDL